MTEASPPQDIIDDWRKNQKRLGHFQYVDFPWSARDTVAHWLAYQAWKLYGELLADYDK